MSTLVETVTTPSSPPSVQGSTATFGKHPRGAKHATFALEERENEDAPTPDGEGDQNHKQAEEKGGSVDIPELSVNGGGPPPEAPARKAKSSTATVGETDSAWGANFWVTLIEPQSQSPFYACPATGQVSWDPPVGNFVLPPSAEGEWWELVDENRGLPYYFHTKTNETVWERPDGFVIPLGILQNTALCRRLSARYSQVMDIDIKAGGGLAQPERPTYRRSISSGADTSPTDDVLRRRSQSSTRSASSPLVPKPKPQQGAPGTKRSVSGDQYRQPHTNAHAHHLHGHGFAFGGSQLPPIPASPYATEDSSPPSPEREAPARPRGPMLSIDLDGSPRGKDHDKSAPSTPVNGAETTPPRSRKPAPFVPHRSPQPQSLDAAAELLAHSPIGQNGGGGGDGASPPRMYSPHSASSPSPPASPTGHVSFAPQLSSSPARLHGHRHGRPSTNGQAPQGLTLNVSIDRDPPSGPHSPLPVSAGPGGKFGSLSKGKLGAIGGALSIPPMPEGHGKAVPPPIPRRNTSTPQTGTIRTQDIGAPSWDNEATQNLSPVKARAEGKPILLEMKKSLSLGDETRYSTGGRPVLPDDLASDIQQFVQTEFARQYFTTHRTGFIFRRKIPVEKMMLWQKIPLQSPLLVLNRTLHKDAVKIFKVIQRIMGDRERDRPVGVRTPTSENGHLNTLASSTSSMNASSTSLPSMINGVLEEERWLLTEGLAHGELRDEIYCQLVKQLTGNPNPESLFRGWQLLCVLLVTFPPSKNFEPNLRSFINQRTLQTEGRVDIMAKYCLQRLSIVSKKGPRGKAPTVAEIETAADAAFNPSTFGESLDAVIRLQERTYPHLQVPIILPFLADGILALGGTKSEGIFRIPGDGDTVSELKQRIERGYYNLEGVDDPHVPASLLKLWLRELADPLVPTELYNDCVACARDPDACVQMVARLPTINRRVVLFVISFLQLFLDEKIQSVTKMTSANLALVMAPNLLRCDSESMTVVFTNAPYEQTFVHNLLLYLKCSKVDPGYVPKHGLGSAIASPAMNRNPKRSRRPLR